MPGNCSANISQNIFGFSCGKPTDVTKAVRASRVAYQPRYEALALDVGVNTLFATDKSGLMGRQRRSKLECHDHLWRDNRRITRLAQYLRKRGLKPDRCMVSQLRRRTMRLARGRGRSLSESPCRGACAAEFMVQRMDFRAPGLSRRLNRLLSNIGGRGAIEAKHKGLEAWFGITCRGVVAAYSPLAGFGLRIRG